jgi:WbqC-like protein family
MSSRSSSGNDLGRHGFGPTAGEHHLAGLHAALDGRPRGGTRVAIIQSNYIPWKGYFDILNFVDEFVIYDSVQYTRRDWRNRNRIKTPQGLLWLTIPVEVRGNYLQCIAETRVSDPRWAHRHWRTLSQNYAHAPFFDEYRLWLEELYLGSDDVLLSAINERFIRGICEVLGITTRISLSRVKEPDGEKTERLVRLCQRAGATEYVSGPAGQSYIEEERFARAGIAVTYVDYSGYPEYPQLYPPFEPEVSILDLILNAGPHARRYMKSFPESGSLDGSG